MDEDALAIARTARFFARALEPLSEQQRAAYFVPDGDAHRCRSDLRPSLDFGRHDLLQDAPISCVLVLADGLLMLGRAEMLLTQSHLFAPVDRTHRIFRSGPSSAAGMLAALAVGGPRRMSVLRHTTEAAFAAAPGAQVVLDVAPLPSEGGVPGIHLVFEEVTERAELLGTSRRSG